MRICLIRTSREISQGTDRNVRKTSIAEVSWLWYPFIPYSKLTIIQGDLGDGKTIFILNIAAKLSKGEGLDGEMKLTEPLDVIYQSAEDGFHWLGDYEITADEVLGGIVPKANKLEQAKQLLRELADTNNAMQSNEIFSIADEQGISKRTLENVKKELGVRAKRINNTFGYVYQSR